MELNATLFIQGIHFLCAYGTLRTFLFKPVVAALKQEQDDHDHLLLEIESRKENYNNEHKRLIDEWKAYQQLCATKTAAIVMTKRCLFTTVQPHHTPSVHDSATAQQNTDAIVALLEKRIVDVG